jgi:hypothetical protein
MPSIANYLMGQNQEDIRFQSLEQSFKGFQARKGYSEITFTTDQKVNPGASLGMGGHLFERLPLVLWLDRAKCKEVDALLQPADMKDDHYMDLRLALQGLAQVRDGGAMATLTEQQQAALTAARDTLASLFGEV